MINDRLGALSLGKECIRESYQRWNAERARETVVHSGQWCHIWDSLGSVERLRVGIRRYRSNSKLALTDRRYIYRRQSKTNVIQNGSTLCVPSQVAEVADVRGDAYIFRTNARLFKVNASNQHSVDLRQSPTPRCHRERLRSASSRHRRQTRVV